MESSSSASASWRFLQECWVAGPLSERADGSLVVPVGPPDACLPGGLVQGGAPRCVHRGVDGVDVGAGLEQVARAQVVVAHRGQHERRPAGPVRPRERLAGELPPRVQLQAQPLRVKGAGDARTDRGTSAPLCWPQTTSGTASAHQCHCIQCCGRALASIAPGAGAGKLAGRRARTRPTRSAERIDACQERDWCLPILPSGCRHERACRPPNAGGRAPLHRIPLPLACNSVASWRAHASHTC